MDSLDQCIDFLGALFEPDDVIEFRPLPPAIARRWSRLEEIPDVVDWLEQANRDESQRVHAYFGANPRKGDGHSQAEGVKLARCLFADFDGGVVAEDALSRVSAAGFPMPTAIVETGGGVHCWWRLDKPITDAAAWSERMKAVAAALGSDGSVCDWPRIMRLPGFVNWKYESRPRAQLWDVDPSRVYSLEVFAGQAVQSVVVKHKSMSDLTRRFLEEGFTLAAGRRQTMFTVACDLAARGWGVGEATRVVMDRMRHIGLRRDELDDCPRQIANAWKRTRLPILGSAEEAVAIADAVDETPTTTLVDAIASWRAQENVTGIRTGISCLDTALGGGIPFGQMTCLAAAPGLGKSAIALQVAIDALRTNDGLTATWCMGEMTLAALAARAVTVYGAQGHRVQLSEAISRTPEAEVVALEVERSIGGRLKIVTPPLVVDRIERSVVKDKPGLLVVDYLQLVRASRHFQDKTGEINEVLLRLREITTAHNLATVLVTNVAKGCDANTDIGNIGKGSNQIDYDVDNLLFGYKKPGTEDADGGVQIDWLCKKLRQGKPMDVQTIFYGRFQYFHPVIPGVPEF